MDMADKAVSSRTL